MATREQIQAALAFLSAAFPNFQLGDLTLEVYSRHLEDVEPEDLVSGCESLVRLARFFPTIADIRAEASVAKLWRKHEAEKAEQHKRIAERSEWTGLEGERLTKMVAPLKKWLLP